MKHLLLLRHARASSGLGGDDHGRPLTRQGRQDATRLGELLATGGPRPQLALCSSALRARETLEALSTRLDPAPTGVLERELYLADARSLLERVTTLEDDCQTALLVGHNPAIAELMGWLSTEGEPEALARLRLGVPPGTLATLALTCAGWGELAPARARLVGLSTPDPLG